MSLGRWLGESQRSNALAGILRWRQTKTNYVPHTALRFGPQWTTATGAGWLLAGGEAPESSGPISTVSSGLLRHNLRSPDRCRKAMSSKQGSVVPPPLPVLAERKNPEKNKDK